MTDKMREAVARAIWNIRREEEDRCDMDLEDMGADHSVWAQADAAIGAMREALVIELPDKFDPNGGGDWAMWEDLVVRSIKASGLKVKP
ncbi:hypothetical protein [Pseudomonas rhizophila]